MGVKPQRQRKRGEKREKQEIFKIIKKEKIIRRPLYSSIF